MKKYFLTLIILISSAAVFAQTDGISYQAVIIDPNPQEIPGVDLQGNILPNAIVTIRFTILDQNNTEEYQEIQTTQTDAYGMINVMIGQGEPTNIGVGDFTLIDWDGTPRSLQVDIDFEGTGSNFVDLNRQELTFVPYAYHRNITASGDMTVDGTTDLNGVLTVQGPTDLNNSLDVTNGNPTVLSGSLTVDSAAFLHSELMVDGPTNLNDSMNVNNQRPSYFTGNITVDGNSTFNGPAEFNSPVDFKAITVNGPSDLNGQVTIHANMDSLGDKSQYRAYPLLVEGSEQGIAVKVNGDRSKSNNFVSFWDDNQKWGQIEGITWTELQNTDDYKWGRGIRYFDLFSAYYDNAKAGFEVGLAIGGVVAASTASTPCLGLGGCVTAPPPSGIVHAIATLAVKVADAAVTVGNTIKAAKELEDYVWFREQTVGVTYASGSGDYAEWLPKKNPAEEFAEGEIVGVKNGEVTKDTWDAEKIMIVSTRPIVLGNMPPQNNQGAYVKIAFMGQVPTKVVGKVAPGDYILPNDLGGGLAKAVHPGDMKIEDYKKIAGVAWSVLNEITQGLSIVNVAVGINTNDLSSIVYKQQEELAILREDYNELRNELNHSYNVLAELVPGFSDAIGHTIEPAVVVAETNHDMHEESSTKDNIAYHDENEIIYFELSEDQVEASLEMAREQYQAILDNANQRNEILLGKNIKSVGTQALQQNDLYAESGNVPLLSMEDHPFWHQMDTNPAYRKEMIQYIKATFEKAMHTHKAYIHNFTELKVKN